MGTGGFRDGEERAERRWRENEGDAQSYWEGMSLICWCLLSLLPCMLSRFSRGRLFVTLRTIVRQAPLSMGILQARIME